MSEELINQTQFTEQPRGVVTPIPPAVGVPLGNVPKASNKKLIIAATTGVVLFVAVIVSIFFAAPRSNIAILPQETTLPTIAPSPPTYLQEMVNNLEPVVKNSDPQTNPNPFPPVNMRIRMKEPKAQ